MIHESKAVQTHVRNIFAAASMCLECLLALKICTTTTARCILYLTQNLVFNQTLPFVCLTLKAPRKTASENVVCLCRLLNILANFSKLFFAYRQTVWTQIRLLRSSLIWVHTVCRNYLKSQAEDKADDNCCDWRFKG